MFLTTFWICILVKCPCNFFTVFHHFGKGWKKSFTNIHPLSHCATSLEHNLFCKLSIGRIGEKVYYCIMQWCTEEWSLAIAMSATIFISLQNIEPHCFDFRNCIFWIFPVFHDLGGFFFLLSYKYNLSKSMSISVF